MIVDRVDGFVLHSALGVAVHALSKQFMGLLAHDRNTAKSEEESGVLVQVDISTNCL